MAEQKSFTAAAPPTRAAPIGWATFLVAVFAATWLSLSDELPQLVKSISQGHQTIAHFSMHFALSVVGVTVFARRQWVATAALALLAIGLELAQTATTTRSLSGDDLVANLAGVAFGASLVIAVRASLRHLTR